MGTGDREQGRDTGEKVSELGKVGEWKKMRMRRDGEGREEEEKKQDEWRIRRK